MKNVSNDFLALVFEINSRRLPMILDTICRRMGGMTSVGEQRLKEIMNARKLNRRFNQGDYRATDAELGQLRSLGEWLVEQHHLNEGRMPDATPFEFVESLMWAASPLPEGQYERVKRVILSGDLG